MTATLETDNYFTEWKENSKSVRLKILNPSLDLSGWSYKHYQSVSESTNEVH